MKKDKKDLNFSVDYHAERCPVCRGFGRVNWGEKICHACGGCGVIYVPNKPGVPPWPGYGNTAMKEEEVEKR